MQTHRVWRLHVLAPIEYAYVLPFFATYLQLLQVKSEHLHGLGWTDVFWPRGDTGAASSESKVAAGSLLFGWRAHIRYGHESVFTGQYTHWKEFLSGPPWWYFLVVFVLLVVLLGVRPWWCWWSSLGGVGGPPWWCFLGGVLWWSSLVVSVLGFDGSRPWW